MKLSKPEEKTYENAPQGTHTAMPFKLVDFGTQKKDFNGDVKFKPEISLTWELSDEMDSAGKPYHISKRYTLSDGYVVHPKSTLYKDICAWLSVSELPDGFDLIGILEKACNLSIVHKPSADGQKTYANISSITPLKKNEIPPKRVNGVVIFDMTEGVFDKQVFESLPEWQREIIQKSPEYAELTGDSSTVPDGIAEALGEPPAHVTESTPF